MRLARYCPAKPGSTGLAVHDGRTAEFILVSNFLTAVVTWDRTERRLITPLGKEPYIEVRIFNGGYGGDLCSGSEYFPVTQRIADEFRSRRLVEGRKHWGWTDNGELKLRRDETDFWEVKNRLREEFLEEAKRFLAEYHPNISMSTRPIIREISKYKLRKGEHFAVEILLEGDEREPKRALRRSGGALALWTEAQKAPEDRS